MWPDTNKELSISWCDRMKRERKKARQREITLCYTSLRTDHSEGKRERVFNWC